MFRLKSFALGVGLLCMAACGREPSGTLPAAAELTADAIGYYCNMIVVNHNGPKGQIFLTGRDEPLWFTSVRDTLAYTMLPEEPKNIAAIYVNDMGQASWDQPEPGTWVDARQAWYVLGSEMMGGMGAPEAVPFRESAAAEEFAARHGGEVLAFDAVPEDHILAPVETPPE
jgi:copper chaperone NosL